MNRVLSIQLFDVVSYLFNAARWYSHEMRTQLGSARCLKLMPLRSSIINTDPESILTGKLWYFHCIHLLMTRCGGSWPNPFGRFNFIPRRRFIPSPLTRPRCTARYQMRYVPLFSMYIHMPPLDSTVLVSSHSWHGRWMAQISWYPDPDK